MVVLCSVVATVADARVQAAEWSFTPNTSFRSGYTDNPRLLAAGGEGEIGNYLDVGAQIAGGTERLKLVVTPHAAFSRYRSDRDLDTNDQYLDATSSWQAERSAWTLTGRLSRDSTQTSELGTTGLVQDNRRRELASVGTGSSWNISETLSAGANLRWSDIDYSLASHSGLSDYTNTTVSAYAATAASERTQYTLSANGGWLDVPSRAGTTRNTGLALGVSHRLGPRWALSVSAGPSWAEYGEARNSGSQFSADVQRGSERFRFALAVSRQLDAVGTGVLARTDAVGVTASGSLTERLGATLSLRASRNSQLFEEAAFLDYETRYYTAAGSLRWRLSQAWVLALDLEERSQEIAGVFFSQDRAAGYRASLGVTWNGRTGIL